MIHSQLSAGLTQISGRGKRGYKAKKWPVLGDSPRASGRDTWLRITLVGRGGNFLNQHRLTGSPRVCTFNEPLGASCAQKYLSEFLHSLVQAMHPASLKSGPHPQPPVGVLCNHAPASGTGPSSEAGGWPCPSPRSSSQILSHVCLNRAVRDLTRCPS